MSKLGTSGLKDLAVTAAKLASLTLAQLNAKVSDATLAGIAALNTWTRKQTFTPSVNETATEVHGYDATGKSEAGGTGQVVTGGDSSTGAGGLGLDVTGGDGQGGSDGDGIHGTGGGGVGHGIVGKGGTTSGHGLVAQPGASDSLSSAFHLTPQDNDPSWDLGVGNIWMTSASHAKGSGTIRYRGGVTGNPVSVGLVDSVSEHALQTNHATPTAIATWSTLADSRRISIKVTVIAHEPATEDGAKWIYEADFNRNDSSVVTSKKEQEMYSQEDQAAWAVDFNISSQDIQVRVTGEVGKTIKWRAFMEVSETGG